ncbi:MAG: DUF1207 domain-containing protein [Pirellulales bacterium]|nr:DUF1207 domain-containing protein [Pirellulales bacterium]
MKLQPMKFCCAALSVACFAGGLLARGYCFGAGASSAVIENVAAKAPATRAAAPTWFDGLSRRGLADRFGRHDAVTLTSDAVPEDIPHLGPLTEQGVAEEVGPPVQYEGQIVALTDYDPVTYGYSGQPYELHLMPQGLIYRSYMAGAKESRFRSVWHEEGGNHSIWDISLGGNVGILRYGTRGDTRPEGVQLGIEGAGLVRLDRDSNHDVAATDYRFGVPVTWGDSIHQVKLAYYHLSSHVGDEFMLSNPGFQRFNYSRDVIVWGHSLYPTERFRVYGEIGYAFYNDVCDPWELQFGFDYGPNDRTGARGAPFAAINAHLREEVNYGGNLVAQAGWAWRRSPATGLYRVGVEYYNGKDDQFSFFNQSVEKIGLGMWYDY